MANLKLSHVPFERIEVGTISNPRSTFERIEELAEDIERRGLQDPLLVLAKKTPGGKVVLDEKGERIYVRFLLVDGERRWRAMRLIRERDPKAFEEVPVASFVGNEDDAAFHQLAVEWQKESLPDYDRLQAFATLSRKEYSNAQIGERLGLTANRVGQILAVLKCEREVLDALKARKVSLSWCSAVAKKSPEEQRTMVASYCAGRDAGETKRKAARRAEKAVGVARIPRQDVKAIVSMIGLSEDPFLKGVRCAFERTLGVDNGLEKLVMDKIGGTR